MEKERRIKVLSLVAMIVAVLGLSIAFASLSTTLKINGTASMDTASWDVHFDNLSSVSLTNKAIETNSPNISSDGLSVENINVALKEPKDKATYKVDIVNEGSINATITNIVKSTLTKEQEKYFYFNVTYKDGTSIEKDNIINAGDKDSLIIEIGYKEDITVKLVRLLIYH